MVANKNDIIRVKYENRIPVDSEHPYAMLNVDASMKALKELKGNAFKLWFYLAKNSRTMTNWILYRSVFAKDAGVSLGTFDSARDELIDKGYLIKLTDDKKNFIFTETPVLPESPAKDQEEEWDKNGNAQGNFYGF